VQGGESWPHRSLAAARRILTRRRKLDASRGGEGILRKDGDFPCWDTEDSPRRAALLARRPARDHCRQPAADGPLAAVAQRPSGPQLPPQTHQDTAPHSASSKDGPPPTGRPAGAIAPQPTKLQSSGACHSNFVPCGEHRQPAVAPEPRRPGRRAIETAGPTLVHHAPVNRQRRRAGTPPANLTRHEGWGPRGTVRRRARPILAR
jgi:hypothetical protein